MKREHFLWLILLLPLHVSAQDQTNFTQFYLNPYLINPSFTGIDGKASLIVTYRRQWTTIKDGPQIANATFHSPISRRVSLGLSATNDKKGLLDNSGLMLSFGYNIPVAPQSSIRFGISGGISSNSVDLEKILELEDPAVGNLLDNNMSLLGNAGISFHLNTFHAGVSLPVIFEPSFFSYDAFTITEIKPFQSIIFHFSNRFYFNNDRNIFEPYFIYRMTSNLPQQFEVAGILHLNHVLWVGGSLKQDYGISALGGIKLKNTLAIGASYGLKTTGDNELNSPTYEITLGMLLGKQRKKDVPYYSFVDTEKAKIRKGTGKSASELIAEKRRQDEINRKKQQEELARKRQEEEAAKRKAAEEARKQQQEQARQEAIARENAARQQTETQRAEQERAERERLQREAEERRQREALANQQREEAIRKQREEEDRRRAELARQEDEGRRQQTQQQQQTQTVVTQTRPEPEPVQPEPTYSSTIREDTVVIKHKPRFGHIDSSLEILKIEITEHNEEDELERLARLKLHAADPDEHHEGDAHPNAERHEFAKRGGHRQELAVSDYVVAGVFAQETNAKHFADGLKKLGFKAEYGHLTEKGVWYVYLHQSNDINAARAERDKYRKMKMFRDAWLLTVHH